MKPCCQCGPHRLTGVEATSTLESRRLCIWPNVERGSCLEKPVWPKSLHSLPVEHALIIPINQPANTLLQGSNEISIPLTDLIHQIGEYFLHMKIYEREQKQSRVSNVMLWLMGMHATLTKATHKNHAAIKMGILFLKLCW